ncbi:hypothetical protein K2P97_01210 [bacterium]|nr:hypothetical protein [bacterium]
MTSNSSKTSYAAILWVLLVAAAAIGVFVYLVIGDAPRTLPKIKLSYFVDEQEVAESVGKRLFQEINQNKFYWFGTEPGKPEYLDIITEIKKELSKKYQFTRVILDSELGLTKADSVKLGVTDEVNFKENISIVGQKFSELEQKGTPYIFITASIYTTSLLINNPLHTLRQKFSIKPMTFSLAYFPTDIDDEKNMLFGCRTEDHSGTSEWGCVVVSKARVNRRKIEPENQKPWLGIMDLSGEQDYILVLKKK